MQHSNGKTVRICCSFGHKCMILVAAALLISKDIQICYIKTDRQSKSLERHIDKVINTLESEDLTVTVQPVECLVSKETIGTPDNRCPVMSYLRTIPENTIDIVGSTETFYDNPNIQKQRNIWMSDKNRVLPLWDLDDQTLFYLHEMYVPRSIQFPKNSVATCNSPLCPMISNEAIRGKTDWSR